MKGTIIVFSPRHAVARGRRRGDG